MHLYANGELIRNIHLSAANNWFVTLSVPEFDDNYERIAYTWTESEVLGYYEESHYIQNNIKTYVNRPFEHTGTPDKGALPPVPGKPVDVYEFDDYGTPLGVEIIINHVGDCFD